MLPFTFLENYKLHDQPASRRQSRWQVPLEGFDMVKHNQNDIFHGSYFRRQRADVDSSCLGWFLLLSSLLIMSVTNTQKALIFIFIYLVALVIWFTTMSGGWFRLSVFHLKLSSEDRLFKFVMKMVIQIQLKVQKESTYNLNLI